MTPGLALGAGLVAVAGILVVPVELRFRAPGDAGRRAGLEVAWLFGSLRRELLSPVRRAEKRRGGRRPGATTWVRAWRAGLAGPLLRLLRRLRRWIRVDDLRLRARIGLGDPADTGMLLGWLAAVPSGVRSLAPGLELRVEPDFTDAVLDCGAAGGIRVIPLGALASLLLFALSPATLRAAWVLWRGAP